MKHAFFHNRGGSLTRACIGGQRGERYLTHMDQTPDPTIVETKQFRVDLDDVLQRVKGAERKSRPRSIAITKIQEAIMWLGMDLKEQRGPGAESPYPDGYNTSNHNIAPVADNLKL